MKKSKSYLKKKKSKHITQENIRPIMKVVKKDKPVALGSVVIVPFASLKSGEKIKSRSHLVKVTLVMRQIYTQFSELVNVAISGIQ